MRSVEVRDFAIEVDEIIESVYNSVTSQSDIASIARKAGVHHATREVRRVDGTYPKKEHRDGFALGLVTAMKIIERTYYEEQI